MISSSPAGLVENLSQDWGQSRLSVSVCVLGQTLAGEKTLFLSGVFIREDSCMQWWWRAHSAESLPSSCNFSLWEHRMQCRAGCGHSGPRATDTPSPRVSPCAMAQVTEVRESLEPSQHRLHLSFLAKISNMPSSICKGLLFSQYE